MENENVTVLHPEEELNSATVCTEGEELSVCNCENDEEVTLFESEDEIDLDYDVDYEEELVESPKDVFARTAARLVNDWKETNGNPYIKQTCVTQIDIYKDPEDEAPIDTFRTEQVKSYSARSLAAIGAAAFVVACTAETIVKKLLKNH